MSCFPPVTIASMYTRKLLSSFLELWYLSHCFEGHCLSWGDCHNALPILGQPSQRKTTVIPPDWATSAIATPDLPWAQKCCLNA